VSKHSSFTRRQFLRTTGVAATVAAVGPLGFVREAFAATPLVRRSLKGWTHSNPTLAGYERAIKRMKLLPTSDPRSWMYQANIHGTDTEPLLTAWNTCTHGNFFFLAWHRMYLYWFERIVRKYSGVTNWTLPFWNYTDPTQRSLPAPFRSPANSSNALFVLARDPSINAGAPLAASAVNISIALSYPNFTGNGEENFGSFRMRYNPDDSHLTGRFGKLEDTPHNTVHDAIGGLMGNVQTAAQDPIFWIHHSNIDRLWNEWLIKWGGVRDPVGDAWWTTPSFTFFDENATAHKMSACEIVDAATQLGYVYESQRAVPRQQPCPSTALAAAPPSKTVTPLSATEGVTLTSAITSVPVDVTNAKPLLGSTAQSAGNPPLVTVEGIDVPAKPNGYFEVHIGAKPGEVLTGDSPSFIGNITFFSLFGHHPGPAQRDASFKIPPAVASAIATAEANRVNVTFVPRGGLEHTALSAAPKVSVRRVTVSKQE
jgi:hypothetical protein